MSSKTDLLQGTLDMLLMRAVADEALHGYALVHRLRIISGGRLSVPQGSLYPALHRLIKRGLIAAAHGTSENNRRAKFYRLTAKGRKQLELETNRWEALARAIARILRPAQERAR